MSRWKKFRTRYAGSKVATERWYYDACVLDYDKGVYGEITSKKNPKEVLLSHLALGEAYGNCYSKGEDTTKAFLELMRIIKKHIKVVGNDGIDKVFNDVRTTFPALAICDSIHLATAIKNQCNILRTVDPDFCGLDPSKVRELAQKFGLQNFSISDKGLR